MREEVSFAIYLANLAGVKAKNAFINFNYEIEFKRDKTIVTNIDKEIEYFLKEKINEEYPYHSFYGEESEKKIGEKTWYIDPIDGTSNFSKHIPFFSTSIAFESKELSFGVVYSPLLDFLFYSDGEKSFLNGKQLGRKKSKTLKEAEFGICHAKDEESIKIMTKLFSFLKNNTYEVRKYGSTSLEMSYVASSFLDGFIGVNLPLWDFKASYHIAKNAGVWVDELRIGKNNYLIAVDPSLKEEIISTIEKIENKKQ